jgi:uncharacterized protein (DUF1501 family)
VVTKAAKDEHGLNPRQRRFVELFTGGMSAVAAYVRAGYSPNGADGAASKLQGNAKVSAAIQATQRKASEAAAMDRSDLASYLVDVLQTPIGQITETHRLCQEWAMNPAGCVNVKMPSKLAAARQLAEIMGWNKPAVVTVDLSEKLEVIIGRIRGS